MFTMHGRIQKIISGGGGGGAEGGGGGGGGGLGVLKTLF